MSGASDTMQHITGLRLRLRECGYVPLPITHPDAPLSGAGKRPRMTGWQHVTVTPDVIHSWATGATRADTNTGIRCGAVIGADIDILDDGLSTKTRMLIEAALGCTPLV